MSDNFRLFQGNGWKVVASFEGNFPNRMKQLPLDRHFDMKNVKRVGLTSHFMILFSYFHFILSLGGLLLIEWFQLYQVVLEADGYQPYLISPEKGLRSLIKSVLEMAKEPSRLCVDEVHVLYACTS